MGLGLRKGLGMRAEGPNHWAEDRTSGWKVDQDECLYWDGTAAAA